MPHAITSHRTAHLSLANVPTIELLETIKRVNTAASAFDKGEGRKAQEAFAELDAKIKAKFGE